MSADHLSRVKSGEPPEGVNDDFSDTTISHCPTTILVREYQRVSFDGAIP